jgi:hypothetical protein
MSQQALRLAATDPGAIAGSCTVSATLSVCKTRPKSVQGESGTTTTYTAMNETKVQEYFTEWMNPKVGDQSVGKYVLACNQIGEGVERKTDATQASICGYLKFNAITRYFGCDANTNCTYAAQVERATRDTGGNRGGHFYMQFPACESMKAALTAICNANSTQIDSYIATQRITGTRWVPSSAMSTDETKCKNIADGGVQFDVGVLSGSGSGSASASVLCGSGDTDSQCVHCASDTYGCNSKDCKFEGEACVAGNGLMTATVDKGSKFFLTLTVTLPYTKDQFDQSKQDKYTAAVASAAGTVAANVEIVKITEARRRAGKVAVETKVRHYTLWSRRAATCSGLARRLHLKQSPGTACLR